MSKRATSNGVKRGSVFSERLNCQKMTDGERTDFDLTKAVGKRLI